MKKLLIYSCISFFLFPLTANAQTESTSLFVDGVCGMCADRIEAAALNSKGVVEAEWDVTSHQLEVVFDADQFKLTRLQRQLAEIGHDNDKFKAPDEVYEQLHGCCKYRDPEIIADHQPAPAADKVAIFVNGTCAMCRDRIHEAAGSVVGIKAASWDMETRMLTVDVDPEVFSVDQLHWAMTGIGHDTREWLASDDAYNSLHDCCQYREIAPPVPAEDPVMIFPDISLNDKPVSGKIFEINSKGKKEALIGVNIYWEDTKTGTSTDENGVFEMARNTENQLLIVSYVGYESDTIDMSDQQAFELTLSEANMLDVVEVNYRKKTSAVSFIDPIKVLQIDERELLKAACCNLSESFETNPSVDVSFTDAVTGTRQIQMLGLAGPYVQITQELMPGARALSSIQGLTFIPGPWISGIQLIKGPGSVVNGFESMTGQINVELKKPENSERLYVNLYANEGGRLEANINTAIRVNEKVNTGILLHGNLNKIAHDRNDDGFIDNPNGQSVIAINRWKFENINGWNSQIGIKGTFVDKSGGQLSSGHHGGGSDPHSTNWESNIKTNRMEFWGKLGKVFPNNPFSSIGFQFSGVMHRQNSFFGISHNSDFVNYSSDQNSAYFNSIYQGRFGTTAHQFKTGLSFQYDDIQENLSNADDLWNYQELVPGAYFEYTYQPTAKFTAVAGLRGDYHNLYGAFFSPRVHLRYAPRDETVFRASAGRGQRRPLIYMEQMGVFASSRSIIIMSDADGEKSNQPYGLDPEVSWNLGLNFTQGIQIAERDLLLSVDAYHTLFQSQVIADFDASPQTLVFYNLDGRSYSNSLQFQADYEILPRWDVRLAYRFNDVQMEFEGGLREKPFVAKHRSFINTGYETLTGWAFDVTVNWLGSKRVPDTFDNPAEFQVPDRSPSFFMVNSQISKSWNNVFDVYVGVENLLDFTQENPIISAEDPTSPNFDASLIWGPIFGRMLYTGIRFRLK